MTPMNNKSLMTLEEIKANQHCKIVSVNAVGLMKQRLMNMGLRPNKTVQMIKSAPLKDPLEISIGMQHISIRRSEAALVLVQEISDDQN